MERRLLVFTHRGKNVEATPSQSSGRDNLPSIEQPRMIQVLKTTYLLNSKSWTGSICIELRNGYQTLRAIVVIIQELSGQLVSESSIAVLISYLLSAVSLVLRTSPNTFQTTRSKEFILSDTYPKCIIGQKSWN